MIFLRPSKQSFPRAPQRPLNAPKGRVQNIHIAGFNFLNCAGVKPHHFRQSFLRESLIDSLTPNIGPQ
jgi:hypothetical protein